MASRCRRPFAEPTAGFWPRRKYPDTFPSIMSMAVRYVPWSPLIRGR